MSTSAPNLRGPDYSGVTETPGDRITREAAAMAVSRYELVRRAAAGMRVLEVGCGSGQGIGYVARSAVCVVGGDITMSLLRAARRQYAGSQPLVQFDAHRLPFKDGTFEVIELHEAIYYMESPEAVARECRRVLKQGGTLFLTTINPQWKDFNPSPYSIRYLSAVQLKALLEDVFSTVEVAFGFPVNNNSLKQRLVSILKRAAVRARVVPRTLAGKAWLKRIFLGELVAVPPQLTPEVARPEEPVQAPLSQAATFKVIYAVARC